MAAVAGLLTMMAVGAVTIAGALPNEQPSGLRAPWSFLPWVALVIVLYVSGRLLAPGRGPARIWADWGLVLALTSVPVWLVFQRIALWVMT